MREKRFDVLSLLEKPEPWALPLDLLEEWNAAGPERLSPGERTVLLAYFYVQEVHHGGHEYWFGTPYADYAEETVAALEALGMAECAGICRRSFEVWPDGGPPEDFDKRESVITDEWLGDDPDGVMDRLDDLDREVYAAVEREDDLEHVYRYMAANPGDFGIDAGDGPEPDEVLQRLREARDRDRSKRDAEEASTKDEAPKGPVPESDEFRPGTGRVLMVGVPAVLLMFGALLLRGEGLTFIRVLGFVVGLALLRLALMRLLFRVRMDPDGVHITGKPGIPWAVITGCRLLRYTLGPTGGFEIEYDDGTGARRCARVPRTIERYREAFRMFLELSARHDAPWSAAEGLRKLRELSNLEPD